MTVNRRRAAARQMLATDTAKTARSRQLPTIRTISRRRPFGFDFCRLLLDGRTRIIDTRRFNLLPIIDATPPAV